ncbi:MAG: hypothetical protein B7X54_02330 [Idiomarina sp. 34-48-12]|nr:MAG: hypothetical protein B7X54_02330 [Idiomarina sp. 34-48-12]
MNKTSSRGFILLESLVGIAILGIILASVALALPRISAAIEAVATDDNLTQQLVKQRLETQLQAYQKFADTM